MSTKVHANAKLFLGLATAEKFDVLRDYYLFAGLKKVVILSPEQFKFKVSGGEHITQYVDWPEIIMYRTFYPLLEQIDRNTLVVVNECLRSQNRNDLTYNCIRHYLRQAGHVVIFQHLPFIDSMQDFMVLFDFATNSQWKHEQYDVDMLEHINVKIKQHIPIFNRIDISVSDKTQTTYQQQREKLFAEIGNKDPHSIPRQLYLIGGKDKIAHANRWVLARNNRLKYEKTHVYKQDSYLTLPMPASQCYQVVEFPHSFIDFSDVMCLSGHCVFDVLVADLKVDEFYMSRYQEWAERIKNGYSDLRQFAQCL